MKLNYRNSPVWRASRAAVKRRRIQTFIIGLVVMMSTFIAVFALGLIAAVQAGPFKTAFNEQHGAHAIAVFDASKASDAQLAATAHATGVTAAAGPFAVATAKIQPGGDPNGPPQEARVLGRATAGGDVDQVKLWAGRWVQAPGEIVLNMAPGQLPDRVVRQNLGQQIGGTDGGPTFTVVGYAFSVSGSADAWVTPDQAAAMHPKSSEMLYRFRHAGSPASVADGLKNATAGLPQGALMGSQSWLTTADSAAGKLNQTIPMLLVFGVLGLVVAVLIVLNVVGGAVVSGFRDIGVYKTIGFTPRQVCAVFVSMMAVPAVVGTVLGLPLGSLMAGQSLSRSFADFGGGTGVAPWVYVACLIGMPLILALAAVVPASRAARMSATAAITAGSAPKRGRGLRVQRKLAGSRLPRSVSLGLGQPFARPGRSFLTTAAVLVGVTTAVFATGMVRTMTAWSTASDRNGAFSLDIYTAHGPNAQTPQLSAADMEKQIRALPGVDAIAPLENQTVSVAGMTERMDAQFYGGDAQKMGFVMISGHWMDGPDQIVAPTRFLNRHHLAVGQSLTLQIGDRSATATIVGQEVSGGDSMLITGLDTLEQLAPGTQPEQFEVHLKQGSDIQAAAARLRGLDPAWRVDVHDRPNPNQQAEAVTGAFTVVLCLVAGLGVFNTVLLNTRERRRDLGMLKSIGMTPRQVVGMIVTSMGMLGLAGALLGVPLGYALHQTVLPIMNKAGAITLTPDMLHVFSLPLLAGTFAIGLLTAMLGALVPARSAARMTIAPVLRNE